MMGKEQNHIPPVQFRATVEPPYQPPSQEEPPPEPSPPPPTVCPFVYKPDPMVEALPTIMLTVGIAWLCGVVTGAWIFSPLDSVRYAGD